MPNKVEKVRRLLSATFFLLVRRSDASSVTKDTKHWYLDQIHGLTEKYRISHIYVISRIGRLQRTGPSRTRENLRYCQERKNWSLIKSPSFALQATVYLNKVEYQDLGCDTDPVGAYRKPFTTFSALGSTFFCVAFTNSVRDRSRLFYDDGSGGSSDRGGQEVRSRPERGGPVSRGAVKKQIGSFVCKC